MEEFIFNKHTFETENPESSYRVQLGSSYVFTTPSPDPDQRIFKLRFPTMKFFYNSENLQLDANINPSLNMYGLILFYQAHKMHKSFHYEHPIYGTLEVRFNKPLIEPEGIPGGTGAVKSFEVELIEVP